MAMYDTRIERNDSCIVRETEKAICVSIGTGQLMFGRNREVWLPKSQVEWAKANPCYSETIHIPAWLARNKGFAR